MANDNQERNRPFYEHCRKLAFPTMGEKAPPIRMLALDGLQAKVTVAEFRSRSVPGHAAHVEISFVLVPGEHQNESSEHPQDTQPETLIGCLESAAATLSFLVRDTSPHESGTQVGYIATRSLIGKLCEWARTRREIRTDEANALGLLEEAVPLLIALRNTDDAIDGLCAKVESFFEMDGPAPGLSAVAPVNQDAASLLKDVQPFLESLIIREETENNFEGAGVDTIHMGERVRAFLEGAPIEDESVKRETVMPDGLAILLATWRDVVLPKLNAKAEDRLPGSREYVLGQIEIAERFVADLEHIRHPATILENDEEPPAGETDIEFLARLAERPSWLQDRERMLRIIALVEKANADSSSRPAPLAQRIIDADLTESDDELLLYQALYESLSLMSGPLGQPAHSSSQDEADRNKADFEQAKRDHHRLAEQVVNGLGFAIGKELCRLPGCRGACLRPTQDQPEAKGCPCNCTDHVACSRCCPYRERGDASDQDAAKPIITYEERYACFRDDTFLVLGVWRAQAGAMRSRIAKVGKEEIGVAEQIVKRACLEKELAHIDQAVADLETISDQDAAR